MDVHRQREGSRGAQVSRWMLCSLYLLHETPSLQLPRPHPRLTYKPESLQLSRLPRLTTECHLAIASSEEGKFCHVTNEAVGISSIFFFQGQGGSSISEQVISCKNLKRTALSLSISIYLMPSGLGLKDR